MRTGHRYALGHARPGAAEGAVGRVWPLGRVMMVAGGCALVRGWGLVGLHWGGRVGVRVGVFVGVCVCGGVCVCVCVRV